MGSIGFPVTPILAATGRRALLKQAVGLGLAIPALGALSRFDAAAQESTPSDHVSGGTGDATPVPGEIIPFTLYDPVLLSVTAGPKEIVVECLDRTLFIAKDVPYAAWTFDGTVPGRVLRVVEGDMINFTLKNSAAMAHSLDFHSAKTPPDKNYPHILPGEEFSFSFEAKVPGAYMYHCGTPPVMMHIGAGMYGAMIVDPKEGWSPAQELVLVQSEFYASEGENGVKVPDYAKMATGLFYDHLAFNGYANQYVENPIPVKVGEPIRIFVVNCGPSVWSSFHVVGAIFDKAYINAHPKNELFGLQSITIGPGDGACVEFTLEEPGMYVAVNHSFAAASKGAIAILNAS